MIERLLDKPIMMMTGSEFLELLKMAGKQEISTVSKDFTGENYVYGISGLAKLLGCGKTRAQEIKNSGVIDEAIYQTGKKVIIDSALALQLIQQSKK